MRLSLTSLIAACTLFAAPAHATRITVSTDIRLDLAGAAQLLAPPGPRPEGFAEPDIPYARALKKALARFKDHPAVRMNASPKMLAFNFSDRSQVLLRLSPPPALTERLTVQYSLIDRAGGKENLKKWLSALRDFSKSARFPELFAAEGARIEKATASFRDKEAKQDYLGTLERYAGLPLLGTYSVRLTPFQATGGVANGVSELEDGAMEIVSVIGPEIGETGEIDFWSRRVPGTLWHEASHGVLDGLGDLYADRISQSAALHDRIGWSCYGTWNQCVKEHIVRAVMIRLIARNISEEASEEQFRFEREEHYPYMRALLASLKAYEKDRAHYPTLADYYPRLLEAFPPAPPAEPAPARQLSSAERLRAGLIAKAIAERARQPEALALARRIAPSADKPSDTAVPASPRLAGPPQNGIAAFRAGKMEEALVFFDEALKTSPEDIETWMSRGVVLQALERKPQALISYDRAVALAEAQAGRIDRGLLPDALSSRASLLLELGRSAQAREDLNRALTLSPKDWPQRADTLARLKSLSGKRP